MLIVVLGEHHGERPEEPADPDRGSPTKLAGVPPPDVQLPQRETGQGARPRKAPKQRGNREIRYGP